MWNARHDLVEDGLADVHPASDLEQRPPCSKREQAPSNPTPCKNAAYITSSPAKWDSIGVIVVARTGRMHGAGHSRRPAMPRQTHLRTFHLVHEARKSTRTEEDDSHGITKKILGKNREFQTAGRSGVADRCSHILKPQKRR